jgi:positive regulator of sigma E activity
LRFIVFQAVKENLKNINMISPLNVLLVSVLAFYVYNHYKTNFAPFINVSPVKTTLAKDTCEVIKGSR